LKKVRKRTVALLPPGGGGRGGGNQTIGKRKNKINDPKTSKYKTIQGLSVQALL